MKYQFLQQFFTYRLRAFTKRIGFQGVTWFDLPGYHLNFSAAVYTWNTLAYFILYPGDAAAKGMVFEPFWSKNGCRF